MLAASIATAGFGLTVTTAEPDVVPDPHLESLTAVTVYVVVFVGVTLIVALLPLVSVALVLVCPSYQV